MIDLVKEVIGGSIIVPGKIKYNIFKSNVEPSRIEGTYVSNNSKNSFDIAVHSYSGSFFNLHIDKDKYLRGNVHLKREDEISGEKRIMWEVVACNRIPRYLVHDGRIIIDRVCETDDYRTSLRNEVAKSDSKKFSSHVGLVYLGSQLLTRVFEPLEQQLLEIYQKNTNQQVK